ncbi:bifunctional 4-hydroxy-2-oxoglutarate aldolase/2-dehydro-3-deoxy-phosphogluconate aldolase [Haloprofundus salinisoli]|uniref:bifunctional 4-hydroxy-2-oxoglutarate aldolase/2-dehydro-3-deoxy-phosphogluconate aldolase n=1 Tax=Haloprofundus salinisoli TaxID=2876193 RepID=UPI001CC9CAD8|nr:bifunctional 4-hydroxy-2-oxoglutarate aldolase/2-dehydro-3-deoxy-phosphogluconate aldolase [Haloprofundus salinisoli]
MTTEPSTQSQSAYARIAENGVIGIVRGVDPDRTIDVVDALVEGGIDTVEITADTAGVLGTLEAVTSTFDHSEVLIGAGTVLDSETARAVLLAGASFVVTPSFDPGVVETCNRYGAVVAPGVQTPTEAVHAYEAGADLLKIFPASSLGPEYVRSLGGPLPQLPLVPTGGVSLDNVEAYVDAGATAVGVGSSLVDSEAIAAGEYGVLTERAEQFRAAIDRARSD